MFALIMDEAKAREQRKSEFKLILATYDNFYSPAQIRENADVNQCSS